MSTRSLTVIINENGITKFEQYTHFDAANVVARLTKFLKKKDTRPNLLKGLRSLKKIYSAEAYLLSENNDVIDNLNKINLLGPNKSIYMNSFTDSDFAEYIFTVDFQKSELRINYFQEVIKTYQLGNLPTANDIEVFIENFSMAY